MTITFTDAREQFEELCWALVKREPIPTEYNGEPALDPLDLCEALYGSDDIFPGEALDDLMELLAERDLEPDDLTFGAIAKSVHYLLDDVDANNTAEISELGLLKKPRNDDRSYARFCWDAFVAARKVLADKSTTADVKSEAKATYFDAAASIECLIPEDDEARAVYFHTAQALIEDGHTSEAIDLLKNLQDGCSTLLD